MAMKKNLQHSSAFKFGGFSRPPILLGQAVLIGFLHIFPFSLPKAFWGPVWTKELQSEPWSEEKSPGHVNYGCDSQRKSVAFRHQRWLPIMVATN